VISASVTARAQGSRVEVESMRTETSTTWSNPDGTMTTDAHAAPIRFKTAKGAWQSINLTLQKAADGTVAPRGHEHGLRLGKRNAAAGQVFASASSGTGRQVEWLSPWRLPEPTLDGTKATYADVQPGVDLVLDARRSGFENDFIVKQRPATAPVWRIPLRTKGLTPRMAADGSVEFVDAKNVVRSKIPVGFMWDATADGVQGSKTVVKVTVEQVSRGKATLVIAPDAKWFLDPARVFPVTVDPTYLTGTLKSTFDTWVQSGVTTDQSDAVDLRVGKNGSATVARAYMNFATSTFAGKDILSASMSLWQYGANTCTPTVVQLRSATPATTATRWTAQPTLGSVYGSVSAAKGATGCAGGRISIPMTGLAQAWSAAAYPTGGLALTAANEADGTAYKRFYSFAGVADPYVTITWNRRPGQPSLPAYSSAVAYAAPGGTSALYSPYLNPWAITKASDADGNTVKYVIEFHDSTTVSSTSLKATCTSATYASGTTGGCKPPVNLPENTLIYVRAKSNDGRRDSVWSGWSQVRIGTQQPAAPLISCPEPYANNTWQDAEPAADIICTVTATGTGFSAPGYVRITEPADRSTDGSGGISTHEVAIPPSSDPAVARTTIRISKLNQGLHQVSAQAVTPAGRLSASTTYSIGWGRASLTAPTTAPRITTTGAVRIAAAGPPRGQAALPTAKVRWRIAGYNSTDSEQVGWNDATTADVTVRDLGPAGVTVTGSWQTADETVDAKLDDPATPAVDGTTLNPALPALLDVQVCLLYAAATQCTWSESKTKVLRVAHAFGGGFPTEDAGVGDVALWTGEFSASASDISVPGASGSLEITRTHTTYAGVPDETSSIFGPGWDAQLSGPNDGVAGLQLVDSTRTDGTLALIDGQGSARVYAAPNGQRRTTAQLQTGTWTAADEATKLAAARLAVSGSGAGTTITYTESNGFETTFVLAGPVSATTNATFKPEEVTEVELNKSSQFLYDPAKPARLVRIVSAAPDGVQCVVNKTTFTRARGCRSLLLEYAAIPAGGDRLVGVTLDTYNPQKSGGPGMDSIKVAAYAYDGEGRLASVTDPRSGLRTGYGYDANNLLTSITPPGQTAYQLSYQAVGDQWKLAAIKRDRPANDPAGGTAVLRSFVYGVPTSGPGLPDLSASSVARWNQKVAPTTGFAVFGAEHPVSSMDPGTLTADDWQSASLQYTDADGDTLNTADFGAGGWQYTSIDEDAHGNVVRSLDQRAIQRIISAEAEPGTADRLSTTTLYNDDIVAGDGQLLTPAGSQVTDVFYPVRQAVVGTAAQKAVRLHLKTRYDEGAPNGGLNPDTQLPYGLETSQTKSAYDPATGIDTVVSRTITDYAGAVSATDDGWSTGQSGQTVTDLDLDGQISAGDVSTVTKYDGNGRVVEDRQPNAADSADHAGVRKTAFYSSAANTQFPDCGGKPEWEGLTCKTYPAAAPTTSAGTTTTTLPTATVLGYSYLLNSTRTEEKSGGVTRTTTSTYLPDGRVATVKSAVEGLTSSTPTTAKSTTYDPVSGLVTATTATAADGSTTSIQTSYDSWGRELAYQPSGDSATTTSYDAAGNVSLVSDSNGSTAYTYDGTDAQGQIERRGLVTKVEIHTPNRQWTSTGAYDASGALVYQKLPGGMTRSVDVNSVGEALSLRYGGQVSGTDADGNPQIDPDGAWLSWSQERDVTGRVVHESTPQGAAFSSGGVAAPYDRSYSYDSADRLTKVEDRTGGDPDQPCVTRSYGFDADSNRISSTVTPAGTDGSCGSTGGTTVARSYDTADRPLTGGNGQGSYLYDELGRTLQIPAADAPSPAGGDLSLAYYDNDLARSISQNGTTTQYLLDPLDRRSTETTVTSAGSTDLVRHYTDGSDNPTWVSTGATTERYAQLVSGQWGLTISGTGAAQVVITNLHGDVVATAPLADDQTPASSLSGWNTFDEYGQQIAGGTPGALNHGWLGGRQRETSDSGLVLMGVRLYNPATGLFTSQDPVEGGGATALSYCSADPVNCSDTTGLFDYSLFYDLGPYVYSAWSLMRNLVRCFTCYFPIKGAKALRMGAKMNLRPYKLYFPVVVTRIWGYAFDAGWKFNTRKGHPDYPGFIQFTLFKIGGYSAGSHIWLSIWGRVSGAGALVGRAAYMKIAQKTWAPLYRNLRALAAACRCVGGGGGGGGGGSW
jgi:RHS repeat-associated protein